MLFQPSHNGGPHPPSWADKIGRARYKVVCEFRAARLAAPRGERVKAAEDWVGAYNTGQLLPFQFKVLGTLTVQTIRRWEKTLLDHNMDYYSICPRHGNWDKGGPAGPRVTPAEAEELLRFFLHPHQLKVQTTIRYAKLSLAKDGITTESSDSTMRRWLKEFEANHNDVVTLARKGEKALKDECLPYITRDATMLEVGDVLVADGKTLNFEIVHPFTGKPCRMTLIYWQDWASRRAVGWEIMPTENTVAISSALYRAIIALGKIPKVVYLDNGKAFGAKYFTADSDLEMLAGVYARLGIEVHLAKAYNPRAKPVERYFQAMSEEMERLLPSYVGSSIEDRPAWRKRNEKFHKARHQNETPTVREALSAVEAYVAFRDGHPHPDYKDATVGEVFEAGRGPGVDLAELRWQFLWRKAVTPRNCRVGLPGITYESDALYGLAQKVFVAWSWWDMSKVFLYDLRGNPLGEARAVEAVAAYVDLLSGPEREAHKARLDHEMKRQKRLERKTKELFKATGEETLLNLPHMKQERVPIPASPERVEAEERTLEKDLREIAAEIEVVEPAAREPELPPRPEYGKRWELYEWCFEMKHKWGRALDERDEDFMEKYERTEAYESSRSRYENLKKIWEAERA